MRFCGNVDTIGFFRGCVNGGGESSGVTVDIFWSMSKTDETWNLHFAGFCSSNLLLYTLLYLSNYRCQPAFLMDIVPIF